MTDTAESVLEAFKDMNRAKMFNVYNVVASENGRVGDQPSKPRSSSKFVYLFVCTESVDRSLRDVSIEFISLMFPRFKFLTFLPRANHCSVEMRLIFTSTSKDHSNRRRVEVVQSWVAINDVLGHAETYTIIR